MRIVLNTSVIDI